MLAIQLPFHMKNVCEGMEGELTHLHVEFLGIMAKMYNPHTFLLPRGRLIFFWEA